MKELLALALSSLAGFGLYYYRRSLFARLIGLSPPRYDVSVTWGMAVTMPHGVQLVADHYSPKAYAPRPTGDFPTILIRVPYGRGGALGAFPARCFAERGYHVIVQDARGCFDSGGEFRSHVNEAADGRATLDWIAQQPWFNGELGLWGPSYLGYMQWAVAANAPPFLKTLTPSITSSQNLTVTHPDGAFGLETRLRWVQGIWVQREGRELSLWKRLTRTRSDERNLQAAFLHLPLIESDTVATGEALSLYRHILTHDCPDDPFWQARDHSAAVSQVSIPVHFTGGWYDYYLRGLLADYAALRAAGQRPHLTIGPWFHAHPGGMMTMLRQGLVCFDAHLRGERGGLRQKPVHVHLMGADEWREMDDWPPPAQETRYFLHPQARLATESPPAESSPDHYVYDPADPTPATGGPFLGRKGAGPQDNRALEARPDVLCYTTPPLQDDVDVIGPVRMELYVRSSLAHTDFFARLCDVKASGRSINVCDGLFRVEPGKGEPQPDGSLRIEIDMWATAYRFRTGHRLRLQVSSGAHPRWSRNLGTGEPLATGTRMVVAEQAVYHDGGHPSALVLPLV